MSRRRTLLAAAVISAGSLSLAAPTVVASQAAGADSRSAVDVAPRAAARQRVGLQMHPQIAQAGASAASASSAWSAMTATIKPSKKGRPLVLQRKQGQRWVTVAKQKQKGSRAEFSAPYARNGKAATYRVSALRYRGLKPVKSAGVSTAVADADGFRDDFGGTALDATKWATRAADYEPSSQRRCSKSAPEATRVAGGTARLSVLADPPNPLDVLDDRPAKCRYDGKNYDWRINGHVGTQGKYSFTYGYAAARIKFQPRRGQHGAFWLMPQTDTPLAGPARDHGAEIDVIESFGPMRNGGLASFIHHRLKPGGKSTKVGGWLKNPSRFGKDWAKRYHVFSVEWTPSKYVFRIDGKETYRTSQGISAQPEYLILSLLSSDYELAALGGEDKLPQTMNVDWVRTWER